jgi:hypothetical protein
VQVVVLPSASVDMAAGILPMAPVAALFALATLATTLAANGVPVLQSVLTGDLSQLGDPKYYTIAAPGTIATFAVLRAPRTLTAPCSHICHAACAPHPDCPL